MGVLRPSGFKDETEAAISLVRFFVSKEMNSRNEKRARL
jgi:hypothetical protein